MKQTPLNLFATLLPFRRTQYKAVIGTVMAIAVTGLTVSSCIYERPRGDDFYRTLWESEEVPIDTFDLGTLTLEFLCNDGVSIRIDNYPTLYGTYDIDNSTAVINGLTMYIDSEAVPADLSSGNEDEEKIAITFIEAHRNGDTLFLLWRIGNTTHPFTTAMKRLSAYRSVDQ